jgi:hypothetical protein
MNLGRYRSTRIDFPGSDPVRSDADAMPCFLLPVSIVTRRQFSLDWTIMEQLFCRYPIWKANSTWPLTFLKTALEDTLLVQCLIIGQVPFTPESPDNRFDKRHLHFSGALPIDVLGVIIN